MRAPDKWEALARVACFDKGIDPDARLPMPGNVNRTMPAWCLERDQLKKEAEASKRHSSVSKPDLPKVNTRTNPLIFNTLIEADNELEADNIAKVMITFAELMKTPVIKAGAVMPDACPAGPLGTIPVGGVVSSTEIHPGFHSADICCSVALSVLDDVDPKLVLDAGMKISHFGPGGRSYSHDMQAPEALLAEFEGNPYLNTSTEAAQKHFATQGDGNHFFYVGRLKSTGQVALVTHHGSRKPGDMLYRKGMEVAENYRKLLSPETLPHNAWIPAETEEGENYWKALQLIRTWTKKNHYAIHDGVAKMLGIKVKDRFWNEHNFIFQKSDGLFYHGKGATPAWEYFAHDATDLTLIPLNMREPILIVKGKNNPDALGFSPHGAGRNLSRTGHFKSLGDRNRDQVLAEETVGIDARFYNGKPDLSELPSAYKNAASVRAQITKFGLADVVDEVVPYGNIMAGDVQSTWRKRK